MKHFKILLIILIMLSCSAILVSSLSTSKVGNLIVRGNFNFSNSTKFFNVNGNVTANYFCNATHCFTISDLAASGSATGTVTEIRTGEGLQGGPITSNGDIEINKTYLDAQYANRTETAGWDQNKADNWNKGNYTAIVDRWNEENNSGVRQSIVDNITALAGSSWNKDNISEWYDTNGWNDENNSDLRQSILNNISALAASNWNKANASSWYSTNGWHLENFTIAYNNILGRYKKENFTADYVARLDRYDKENFTSDLTDSGVQNSIVLNISAFADSAWNLVNFTAAYNSVVGRWNKENNSAWYSTNGWGYANYTAIEDRWQWENNTDLRTSIVNNISSVIDSAWNKLNMTSWYSTNGWDKINMTNWYNTNGWGYDNYTAIVDRYDKENFTDHLVDSNIGNFTEARDNVAFTNETNTFDEIQIFEGDINVTTSLNLDGISIRPLDNKNAKIAGPALGIYMTGPSGEELPHVGVSSGGSEQASFWLRSFMITNEIAGFHNTSNATDCIAYMDKINETLKIDCNTTTTGADLIVSDDMQVVGDVWIKDTDGNWHFMTRSLTLQDELNNNLLLSRSNVSLDGNDFTILDSSGEEIVVTISREETIKAEINESVPVLNGTNSTPVLNLITYQGKSNPVLTRSAGLPSEDYANVARFYLGNGDNSYGGLGGRSAVDEFIRGSYVRWFKQGLLYESGFQPDVDATNISIGTGTMTILLDAHTAAVDKDLINDGAFMILNDGTFVQFNSLEDIIEYADGGTISNNKYYNLVCGIIHNDLNGHRMMCVVSNEPSSEYVSIVGAETDTYESTNIFPSNAFLKNLYLPVARMVVQKSAGGDEFQVLSNGIRYIDVRGSTSDAGAPATSGVTVHSDLTNLDYVSSGHTGFVADTDKLGNTTQEMIDSINESQVSVNCSKIIFSDGTVGSDSICDGNDGGGAGNFTANFTNVAYVNETNIFNRIQTFNSSDGNLVECYQETANLTDTSDGSCVLDYNGVYGFDGSWNNSGLPRSALYDGDWDSITGVQAGDGENIFYINYTKPERSTNNSKWELQVNGFHSNMSLTPACWSFSNTVVVLRVTASQDDTYKRAYCYDGTWNEIGGTEDGGSAVNEEAMRWEVLDTISLNITGRTRFNDIISCDSDTEKIGTDSEGDLFCDTFTGSENVPLASDWNKENNSDWYSTNGWNWENNSDLRSSIVNNITAVIDSAWNKLNMTSWYSTNGWNDENNTNVRQSILNNITDVNNSMKIYVDSVSGGSGGVGLWVNGTGWTYVNESYNQNVNISDNLFVNKSDVIIGSPDDISMLEIYNQSDLMYFETYYPAFFTNAIIVPSLNLTELNVSGGITLGGERRTTWPEAGSSEGAWNKENNSAWYSTNGWGILNLSNWYSTNGWNIENATDFFDQQKVGNTTDEIRDAMFFTNISADRLVADYLQVENSPTECPAGSAMTFTDMNISICESFLVAASQDGNWNLENDSSRGFIANNTDGKINNLNITANITSIDCIILNSGGQICSA